MDSSARAGSQRYGTAIAAAPAFKMLRRPIERTIITPAVKRNIGKNGNGTNRDGQTAINDRSV
jgi:hypothetical protein